MNDETIKFHLDNIVKNNRFNAHKKELETEISDLRLMALKFKGTALATTSNIKANGLEKKLNEAVRKRLMI